MVSAGPASSDARPLKLCPSCGRTTDAESNRCPHCLADVTHSAVLGVAAAEQHAEADRVDDARRARRRRRSSQREIWIRRAIVGAVLAAVAWWGYSTFIYEPPPVPIASSPAIGLATAPEAWPIEGGNAGGTRAAQAPSAIGGTAAWSVDLGGAMKTAMVTNGQHLFIASDSNEIVALDVASGRQLWAQPLQNAPYSAPTVAGDLLYVALLQGKVIAFHVGTGEVAWEGPSVVGTFPSSPIVADGVVYAFGTHGVFGFDALTGERLMGVEHESTWATITPVIDGPYVSAAGGSDVKVINRVSGLQSYFLEFARSEPYSVIADNGEVFAVYRGTASAFDVTSRRPWWERFRAAWSQAWIIGWAPSPTAPPTIWFGGDAPRESLPAVLAEDRLLIAGRAGELVALSRATGETLWSTTTAPVVAPPLLAADGLLLAHRNSLSLVDPTTGDTILERPFPDLVLTRIMVTAHGLFIGAADGTVRLLR